MKKLRPSITTKKMCSLTLAILFSISPSVLANNPEWARDYIGNLNFQLKDDPDLARRIQKLDTAQNEFNKISAKASVLKDKVKKLDTERDSIVSSIDSLEKLISKEVIQKNGLTNQKKVATQKKQAAKSELDLAKAALTQATAAATEAQNAVTNLEKKLADAKTECTASPSAQCQKKVERLTQKLAQANKELSTKNEFKSTAQKNVKTKTQILARVDAQIGKLTESIAKLDNSISSNGVKLVTLKNQKKTKIEQLRVAKQELAPVEKQLESSRNVLTLAKEDKQKYRQRLIARVLDVNRRGALEGADDGHSDGRFLADRLGSYHGSRDGDSDGQNDGLREGRERERSIGYSNGQVDGAARALSEGSEDGTIDGTRQGNIDAATRIGKDDGTNRANSSDAASVGRNQGNLAGMQRAINTGNSRGSQIGQTQAIQKFESAALKKVQLNGDFAGAFARVIPNFPVNHQGRNFDPNGKFNRRIVNSAFSDGYKARYRRRLRASYETNITNIYNSVYDTNYNETFDDFFNRSYPDMRRSGYEAGERDAYNRDYQRHFDNAYNRNRTQFSMNPNRNSNEFKQTYAKVEADTYNSVYESIRRANYASAEEQTFNANIAAQTEIFRSKRHAEVSKIYSEKPVLKFESSSIEDVGINGVAARDGVFQPSENTLHSIVITNYGKVDATNVKVVMENGKEFKVPTIPAGSTATVKGVSKSSVIAQDGSVDTKIITAYSPLSAEVGIQGRHFANPSQGQINAGDKKQNRVKFPLKLTALSTAKTPIIGQANSLQVTMVNESKRNYTGEIKVTLDVNSNSKIITKGFNPVASLGKSTTLKDATLLINDESDIFTPLTFRAIISKNGVTLGHLDSAFTTMAKAPYIEKRGKPIVVANSETSTRDLVDLLSTMGGLSGASVLDVSLEQLNRSVLGNGLKGQTLLLLEKGALKQIDGMLKKSENTSVVLIDELKNGTSGLRKISTFKDAEEFDFNVAGLGNGIKMIFANPMRVGGLKSPVPVAIASMNNYKNFLSFSELMKLSNDQILSRIQTGVNTKSFFSANQDQKQLMQMANIRAIDEVMRINKHYQESGGGLSRDKDIADLVRDDNSLLHNRLSKLVDGKTRDNNASLFLFAHDFYYTIKSALSDYDPIEDRLQFAIHNRMFGALFIKAALKEVKKSYKALKKYDKNLYKKVEDLKGLHAPFVYVEDTNNSRR
ncbi:hypothetical protein [Halobacteriovorax sp. HLS]|uniref:hypothetical protein n=1 Tax=Halobacteriovorax sp. HLS TaxID=2234000 RepID=UPI000FDC1334|nr:hypothetical protein [Halobacteriovorax sp. HLS]